MAAVATAENSGGGEAFSCKGDDHCPFNPQGSFNALSPLPSARPVTFHLQDMTTPATEMRTGGLVLACMI